MINNIMNPINKTNDETILNTIGDLILFYVKNNYDKYLIDNDLKFIETDMIRNVVKQLYIERKDHIKVFIKDALKELYKSEYPGDLVINNIIFDIFTDDNLNIHRLTKEIKDYQDKSQ